MTVIRLKEHGTYLGFEDGVGYIYALANHTYSINGQGVTKL